MAFLLCYTRDGVLDWRDKAIYLDQEFYEALCVLGAALDSGGVLENIACLRYGEECLLSRAQLTGAIEELDRLAGTSLARHQQFERLCAVLRSALDDRFEIAIAGDMHPERR